MDTSHGSSVQLSNCPPPQRLGVFRPAKPTRSLDAMRIRTKEWPPTPALPPAPAARAGDEPAQKRTCSDSPANPPGVGRFFEMAALLGRRRRPKFRAIVT